LTRSQLFSTLLMISFLPFLSGCATVQVGDGQVEKPLERVTGITTDNLQKAASKSELNLWDVYALAVERTERLASKVEDNEQAAAQSLQAVGAVLPHVFLNGSKNFQSSNYIGSGSPSSNIPNTSLYLSGTQTLLTGLDEVAGLTGAQANSDFQRHQLRNESVRLLLDVARSFYAVLQTEESLKSKQASKESTEKILAQLKNWQAVGRSRASEVLSTQAQLARLNAEIEEAQNNLAQARESLAALASLKPEQNFKSEEAYSIPSYSLPDAQAKMDSRPDVKAAQAGVGVADAFLLQAHGGHLPSLSVQGNYYLQKDGGSPAPEWNLLLVGSLPLFSGGEVVARERLMSSRKRQSEMQLSRTKREANEEIRQAYQSLVSSIQSTDAYHKAMEAGEAEYKAVTADYRNSLTTNLEVLRTLNALEETKDNYARAKYQTLFNQIWLGVATGELPKIEKKD
jgi:outer membrane protein